MMKIMSKEMIKPSSPTPHHLRNHKLSWLDQILPPIHIPIIFFYEATQLLAYNTNNDQVSKLLKTSLSDTLTLFYPFAGKIVDYCYVDCNDDGVELIETQAHNQLQKVLENPDMGELKQFLPFDPCVTTSKKLVLAVQVNYFDCGGIVLGICFSHTVEDCSSLITFVNSWAGICSGTSNINTIKKPNFDLALKFPSRESLSEFEVSRSTTKEKLVTKRFVFDKSLITSLQQRFKSEEKLPSRVEAVSTFIWLFFKKLANAKNKRSGMGHAVNLRPRTKSSHSESNFVVGNYFRFSLAIERGLEECFGEDLVGLLHKSIKEIDNDYVKKLADIEGYLVYQRSVDEMVLKGEIDLCILSSWCRFPLYETDFGWGRPVWVCTTTLPFENSGILWSTSCGDGIEASLDLFEDDAVMLERDKEFNSLFSK